MNQSMQLDHSDELEKLNAAHEQEKKSLQELANSQKTELAQYFAKQVALEVFLLMKHSH